MNARRLTSGLSQRVRGLLFASLALYACVPVYSYSGKVAAGQKTTSEQTSFISPGVTRRDELISKLGKPAVDLSELRILVYPWTELKAQWVGVMPGFIWTAPSTANWALFVATDESNRVTHFGFQEIKWSITPGTVISEARDWAEAEQVALPPASTSFSPTLVPAGKALLYLYRVDEPLAGFTISSQYPLAIAVDGQCVTELRNKTYAAFPIAPGAHELVADPLPSYRFAIDFGHLQNEPSRRPPGTLSVQAEQSRRQYFVQAVSTHHEHFFTRFTIDTSLTLRNESDAYPVVQTLRPAW